MGQIVELSPFLRAPRVAIPELQVPALRTTEIYVIFTTIDETLAAVRIGNELARSLAVPLILIHLRTVPYPLPADAPNGHSPVEMDAFVDHLRALGVDVRVRVYLCRTAAQAIRLAFRCHSLIVVGGRRRCWPTRSQRWRRALEAAGHFVMFVDETTHAA